MTPLPTTPLTPQDGTIDAVPPDRDLGAMVEAILEEAHPRLVEEASENGLRYRLAAIHDTAQRLKVALEQREGVMGRLALEAGAVVDDMSDEQDGVIPAWCHGCDSWRNEEAGGCECLIGHLAAALAKYKEARRVP